MGRPRMNSEWEYTDIFALGNYYGEFIQSVKFHNESVGVIPVLIEFNKDGADPSGSRHLTSHPSFISILASGQGPASFTFDNLDMNSVDISTGSGVSNTKCFIFRITQFDCIESRVHNMKVWASNIDDFITKETHRIVFETHNTWQSGLSLPTNYMLNKSKWLSTSLPDFPNLLRQDGKTTIHGVLDPDVSQYIYIAVAASGTLPLGEYGSTPTSGFLVRITYNLDNITPLQDQSYVNIRILSRICYW